MLNGLLLTWLVLFCHYSLVSFCLLSFQGSLSSRVGGSTEVALILTLIISLLEYFHKEMNTSLMVIPHKIFCCCMCLSVYILIVCYKKKNRLLNMSHRLIVFDYFDYL